MGLLKSQSTGEIFFQTEDGDVLPGQLMQSPSTGEQFFVPEDGDPIPVEDLPEAAPTQPALSVEEQAVSLSSEDLNVAKTKNDSLGAFLRSQAQIPQDGESDVDRRQRLSGSIGGPRPGVGEGVARGFAQGGFFGGGDEVVGAGAAGLDTLLRGVPFSKALPIRIGNERRKLSQFREDEPALALGSEVAGAIPTAVLPFLNAARGSQVTRAIKTGAGQGGIFGFNSGKGLQDRLIRGGFGATLGAGIGAAAGPIVNKVGQAFNRLATSREAKKAGISGPAFNILNRALNGDDSLIGAGAQRIEAAGPEAMLADAGPNAAALLDVAVQSGGPAARNATEVVSARVGRSSANLDDALNVSLGPAQGVRATARDIAQGTAPARRAAYDKAYSKPIDFASKDGKAVESVLRRIPDRMKKNAIEKANEQMQAAGIKNQQMKINIADDGKVTLTEFPNVRQVDQIKRALGELGQEVDNLGRPTGDALLTRGLARDVKIALSKAVPEYARAVKLGGDKIERDNALRLGRKLLSARVTREEVADVADGISDAARTEALRGLRGSIDDALANVKRTATDGDTASREALKLIKDMSSRANREKTSLLLGPRKAKALFDQIDEAAKSFELRARVAGNSATFARTSLKEGIDAEVQGGPLNAILDADPKSVVARIIQSVTGRSPAAVQGLTDDVLNELVTVLTTQGPEATAAMVQRLSRLPDAIEAGARRSGDLVSNLLGRSAPFVQPADPAGRLQRNLRAR